MASASLSKTTSSWQSIRRRLTITREARAAYLFLTPNIFGFACFTAIPVITALWISFHDWDMLLGQKWVGLGNYVDLMTKDAVFLASLRNTFFFTIVSVPLSVGIGLAVALLTNQNLRGINIFRAIFLMPYVTVTVALSLVWKQLFLPEIGLINQVLGLFGIPGPRWLTDPNYALLAIIIVAVWRSFGYNMVLFLAGLKTIPDHLYEAAKIDGASAWQRFLYITMPLLSPTTFFVLVISLIGSFQVFDTALIMTNGGPGVATTTLVLRIYQVGFQTFQLGEAAAIAWVLFGIIFIITIIQFRTQRRWVYYD